MSSEWKTLRQLIETRGLNGKIIVSAEIGLNHNGDPELAKKSIDAAAECGCQAVKFQNYRTGDVVKSRKEIIEVDGKQWNAWDLFSRCELDFDTLRILKEHSEKCGLVFHSTPTNENGIRDLIQLDAEILKMASDVVKDPDICDYAATWFGDNIVASLGCIEPYHIDQHKWLWLHCVRKYPTSSAEANIQRIAETRFWLAKLTAHPLVGYSDHTEGIDCAVSAVKDYGACWLECHVTLDHTLPGPDHRWSKDFTQMKELIQCLQ